MKSEIKNPKSEISMTGGTHKPGPLRTGHLLPAGRAAGALFPPLSSSP